MNWTFVVSVLGQENFHKNAADNVETSVWNRKIQEEWKEELRVHPMKQLFDAEEE